MSQREARRSRAIMKAIRAEGYFVFKVHGSEFMMSGLPDLIVCAEGLFIGLETKHPETRGNVSPRQVYVHSQINEAGGTAVVVTSAEEALRVIHEAIRTHYQE